MRVMGVDPGLTRCGISLVEGGTGRAVTALDVDVVRTPSDLDLARRLLRISDAAEYWMDTHHPDVVAVERVFSQHNVPTAMGTAQAGGVVALAAARRGIEVCFHTPSEVKAAVTGSGSAGKAQVTAMVTRVLGMQQAPSPADAADALALAICHCWRAPMIARMAEAQRRAAEQEKAFRARLAREKRARAKELREKRAPDGRARTASQADAADEGGPARSGGRAPAGRVLRNAEGMSGKR